MSLIQDAFKRLHYPSDVIAQCIRWYGIAKHLFFATLRKTDRGGCYA